LSDQILQQNVEEELRLADLALRAARLLVENDIIPDAASRAYYAALHAARALLFSVGFEPGSHQAVRSMKNRELLDPKLDVVFKISFYPARK
jgi:hypothetical protein